MSPAMLGGGPRMTPAVGSPTVKHGGHRPGIAPSSPREVSLETGDRTLGVVGLLLDVQELGGGGIEAVTRPKRRPLTVYRAPEAPGLSLSFLLDGWREDRSVEHFCRMVEKMAGGFVAGDPGPPHLIVRSQSVPHCGRQEAHRHRWVISEQPTLLDDPPVIRRNGDGDRMRQGYQVTLLLVTEADELERIKPRQPKPNLKTVQARKGDTYEKIAARELGNKRFGRKLAKLNGDTDPDKRLKEGKRVKLPSDNQLDEWKDDLKRGKG